MYKFCQEVQKTFSYSSSVERKEDCQIEFSLEPPRNERERRIQGALYELMERGAVDIEGVLARNIDELRQCLRKQCISSQKAPEA